MSKVKTGKATANLTTVQKLGLIAQILYKRTRRKVRRFWFNLSPETQCKFQVKLTGIVFCLLGLICFGFPEIHSVGAFFTGVGLLLIFVDAVYLCQSEVEYEDEELE